MGVKDSSEPCCYQLLTWVWPVGMDVMVEFCGDAHQGIYGHSSDDVSLLGYDVGSMVGLSTNSSYELCAINEREPL